MEEEPGKRRLEVGQDKPERNHQETSLGKYWNETLREPRNVVGQMEPWRGCVERDRDRTGQTWSEMARMSQDRTKWKFLVCGLYPGLYPERARGKDDDELFRLKKILEKAT